MSAARMNERRTKILATLGPATDKPGVLDALLEAGVDVVRLNFSHGDPSGQAERARAVREMTFDNAMDYLIRAQEAANFYDNQGRKEGIRQFIDEKSYKPGLGAYDKERVTSESE